MKADSDSDLSRVWCRWCGYDLEPGTSCRGCSKKRIAKDFEAYCNRVERAAKAYYKHNPRKKKQTGFVESKRCPST